MSAREAHGHATHRDLARIAQSAIVMEFEKEFNIDIPTKMPRAAHGPRRAEVLERESRRNEP